MRQWDFLFVVFDYLPIKPLKEFRFLSDINDAVMMNNKTCASSGLHVYVWLGSVLLPSGPFNHKGTMGTIVSL